MLDGGCGEFLPSLANVVQDGTSSSHLYLPTSTIFLSGHGADTQYFCHCSCMPHVVASFDFNAHALRIIGLRRALLSFPGEGSFHKWLEQDTERAGRQGKLPATMPATPMSEQPHQVPTPTARCQQGLQEYPPVHAPPSQTALNPSNVMPALALAAVRHTSSF